MRNQSILLALMLVLSMQSAICSSVSYIHAAPTGINVDQLDKSYTFYIYFDSQASYVKFGPFTSGCQDPYICGNTASTGGYRPAVYLYTGYGTTTMPTSITSAAYSIDGGSLVNCNSFTAITVTAGELTVTCTATISISFYLMDSLTTVISPCTNPLTMTYQASLISGIMPTAETEYYAIIEYTVNNQVLKVVHYPPVTSGSDMTVTYNDVGVNLYAAPTATTHVWLCPFNEDTSSCTELTNGAIVLDTETSDTGCAGACKLVYKVSSVCGTSGAYPSPQISLSILVLLATLLILIV